MTEGGNSSSRNVTRRLKELEAWTLFVIWKKVQLTHTEISEALARIGFRQAAGYLRRVVNNLNELGFFETSKKFGRKKENISFGIRRDGVNSRPLTSRILLELIQHEDTEHDSPDRQEFIADILELQLKLKRKKKKSRLVEDKDVQKALEFCELNEYIERRDDTIRSTARARNEQPFTELIALGWPQKRPPTKRSAAKKPLSKKKQPAKPKKRAAGSPVLKTRSAVKKKRRS